MKRCTALAGLAMAIVSVPASAHHGVAGLRAAALDGPGVPIEQSSSANLPERMAFA